MMDGVLYDRQEVISNIIMQIKPNEDVHPKTLKSIFKQAQILNNNS